MSKLVQYKITNETTLKSQTQEVVDKTAFALGFDTARKSIEIHIRFALGASHQSWNSPKSFTDAQTLADWLVSGFHAGRQHVWVPGRPVFDNYMASYGERVHQICAYVFNTYKHYSIRDRANIAGEYILKDFRNKVYQGSLGVNSNSGDYAKRKARKGYGDAPFVATKALLQDLEVVIE